MLDHPEVERVDPPHEGDAERVWRDSGPAGGPPSSHGPYVDVRGRRQDRKQHPPRHRRRNRQLQIGRLPRRLRRHRSGHRPIRHQRQGRETGKGRQQTTQERTMAILVRRVHQTPALDRLLQAQTRTRQTPQRRRHLPRPPTLRRVYCFNVCWAGSAVFSRSVGEPATP